MANVKFERGLEDDVTTEIPTDGHLYVGTDTGNIYLGKNDGTKLPIGQSDWNQTDGTKSDFIKNKPEIPKERLYIAGDNVEITALTDLYTPVEYIKNDSRTYINTGISPQATDFEMELVASLVSGNLYVFQHRQTNSGSLLGFYRPSSSTAPMRLYTGTSTYATTELPSNNVDVFRFVGSVKDGKATITSKNLGTGEEKSGEATIEETPSVGTRRFCLFGNGLGVGASYTCGVDTRIYKARIVQSGVLVMDFIPVVRKSDGRAGFYDLVTGGFFTDRINDVSVLSAGPSISDKEYNIVSVPDIPTDTSDLTNGAGFITSADLPAPYTAGNGIAINSNNEISAKVSEGNGLGFGANGDIALSLVQNSANGAMASDDFRKLYDNVEMVHLLGTAYQLNNWYINSNNNYAASNTYKSYLIPVSSIGKVSIYDSATTTYYSFLKPYEEGGSSNVPGSTDYAYATGYTGRRSVAQGTTAVVSVPSDATWLWVYSGQNKAYDPTSLKFTGIAIGIADGIPSPASTPPLMDGAASAGTSTDYARADHVHPSDTSRVPTTRKVNNKALSADITLTAADVGALPSSTVIPTVGTLNTDNTSAQSVNASESLGGTVKLHKVAKTGTYQDILNNPLSVVDGIPSGADLNDYKTQGAYDCATVAIAESLSNTPITDGAFRLVVMNIKTTSYIRKRQLVFKNNSSYIYTRAFAGTWTAWRNITSNEGFGCGYATDTRESAVAAITADLGEYSLLKGGIVAIRLAYDVPANATLNINGKGAKQIRKDNVRNTAGMLKAGGTVAMMYDGTYYQILANSKENGGYVHIDGTETITGNKTFSGTCTVQTPTADGHAATKKYIDDIVGDIETILASI